MKWLWLLMLFACAETVTPATQVLVVVESDLELGTVLTKLQVAVRSEDGRPISEPFPIVLSAQQQAGKFTLPLSFGVVWQGADRVRVVVTGFGPLGEAGREIQVIEQQALVSFQRERTLRMPVFLGQACVRRDCEELVCYPRAVGATRAGECGPLPIAETELVQPGAELADLDGGTTRDAQTRDAQTRDAETRDARVQDDASTPAEDASTPAPGEDASAPVDASMPVDAGSDAGTVKTGRRLSSSDGSCAIRKDGTVWCWKISFSPGQPTQVPVINDAIEVVAGGSHACARRAEGSLVCWGNNPYGQLGNGTLNSSLTPVVVKGLRDVRAIEARTQRTCALDSQGRAWCWGSNTQCVLGRCDGDQPSPNPVPAIDDAVQLAMGLDHACALQRNGTVMCWGNALNGALGNVVEVEQGVAVPVTVQGLKDAIEIAAGSHYSCALKRDGSLTCWGLAAYNWGGTNIRDIDSRTPLSIITPAPMHRLVAGTAHQCGLTSTGAICRGDNTQAQLGNDSFNPALVANSPENTFVNVVDSAKFVEIAADQRTTCALDSDDRVYCWGENHPNGGVNSKPTLVAF